MFDVDIERLFLYYSSNKKSKENPWLKSQFQKRLKLVPLVMREMRLSLQPQQRSGSRFGAGAWNPSRSSHSPRFAP